MPKYCDVRVRADWPWDRAQIAGRLFYKHEATPLRVEELTDEIKNSPVLEFGPVYGEPESPSAVMPSPVSVGKEDTGGDAGDSQPDGEVNVTDEVGEEETGGAGDAPAEHRERKPRRPKGG